MSRIGNAPVNIPDGVTVSMTDADVVVRGVKGEVRVPIPNGISMKRTDNQLSVARAQNDGAARALHGFIRAELSNAIIGVSHGWSRTLELVGVGYRATANGAAITLTVGFSHPVVITPPEGISFSVTESKIVIWGIHKQLVGQVAAKIRAVKKPEPYKGKGIKYEGEKIRKKAGKSAKAIGASGGVK